MFKRSAKELKSVRSLATTGALIAVYVVMNAFLAVNTEMLKITFGYIALAAIGMLYGPAVAAIAAVPCDIITSMAGSLGTNPVFTFPKILEGAIYGIFLYGYASRRVEGGAAGGEAGGAAGGAAGGKAGGKANQVKWASWQVMRIVAARFFVMAACYLFLNSYLLFYVMGVSGNSFSAFMYPRYVKNVIQFPLDLALMFAVLPPFGAVYRKLEARYGKERAL
ncbi:MAG: folate family ECF transporter S component [Oscillospiraceae bacterium]|jgi:ECF transporter S component (folate family)|nr:folate family ECF transporter S component [Oscillospiraceae bacterium]